MTAPADTIMLQDTITLQDAITTALQDTITVPMIATITTGRGGRIIQDRRPLTAWLVLLTRRRIEGGGNKTLKVGESNEAKR